MPRWRWASATARSTAGARTCLPRRARASSRSCGSPTRATCVPRTRADDHDETRRSTMEMTLAPELEGLPADLQDFIARLDDFIEREIKPLEAENMQFFDHRREWARTDFENDGVHRQEWLELLHEMRRRADAAGVFRYALPSKMGGLDGTNLGMAVIRDYLASKGLGLHNDLQTEASVVGNLVFPLILDEFGTEAQKEQFLDGAITGEQEFAFNLTEPGHGSDATWLETRAVRDGGDWVVNGGKRFASGV